MRKFIAFCTSLFVAITFLTAGTGQALAAPDYSIVRVNLLSLGSPTTLTVTLTGNYSIPENGQVDLQQKSYQIKVLNGQLNLIDGTTTIPMGTKFTFKRHEGSGSGIKINNSYTYSGDMEAQIYGGYIRMINHVYLETYLYGVVPYEISNSWPVEVLKAQAIAARTYAVRYKSSGAFDVYDTQASQVYRGYNANHGNAIKAVDQTAGKVLKYGSSFVDASYSSSNGGKTQSAGNAWGGSNPGYSVIKDDPYDIKNTSNPNRSWTVVCSKAGEKLNATLTTNFKNELKTTLENKGYSGVAGDITIKEVKSVSIDAKDSGDRLTKGKVTLSLDVKNKSTGEIETIDELSIDLNKSNTRNMLNLNSLLFMVNETETAFELKGSGWGHGVGMSQYGAYQMALEGFNYAQILDFYYPNTSTDTLSIKPPVLTPKPDRGDKPAPEPPKEDPPKVDPPAQSLYGTIKVSSSLNVRSGPGTGYGIVGSLKNGAQVEILEKGGSWHKVKSGNITGYVSSQYVQISSTPSTPPDKPIPPTNPPDATPPSEKYGTVTASKLNVRTGPGTRNSVVGYVYRGNRVKVLSSSGGWHKISYGSLTGYVSDDYIKLETSGGGSTPPPTNPTPPAQTVTGKGTVTASSLTVRSGPSTGNSKIGSLARNATVNIVGSSGVWYKIQYGSGTGYVHRDYIKLQTGGGNTPPPTNPTPTNPTPPAQTVTGKGTVTASSLIVRSGPSTGSSKLGSLARNATVNIIGSSGVWCKIQYGSGTGYVHGDYIKVTSGTPTPGRGDDGSSGRTGVVNASALNLRTGPGTNYTSIKLLKKGETVQILSQSGVWLQIKSADGKTGYVHKDYVK